MNASKERVGPKDLKKLFADATEIAVAKGKKVLTFQMQKDPPSKAELEKAVLGPTGNLRAPSLRIGKRWLIGFHEDAYGERLG